MNLYVEGNEEIFSSPGRRTSTADSIKVSINRKGTVDNTLSGVEVTSQSLYVTVNINGSPSSDIMIGLDKAQELYHALGKALGLDELSEATIDEPEHTGAEIKIPRVNKFALLVPESEMVDLSDILGPGYFACSTTNFDEYGPAVDSVWMDSDDDFWHFIPEKGWYLLEPHSDVYDSEVKFTSHFYSVDHFDSSVNENDNISPAYLKAIVRENGPFRRVFKDITA